MTDQPAGPAPRSDGEGDEIARYADPALIIHVAEVLPEPDQPDGGIPDTAPTETEPGPADSNPAPHADNP